MYDVGLTILKNENSCV